MSTDWEHTGRVPSSDTHQTERSHSPLLLSHPYCGDWVQARIHSRTYLSTTYYVSDTYCVRALDPRLLSFKYFQHQPRGCHHFTPKERLCFRGSGFGVVSSLLVLIGMCICSEGTVVTVTGRRSALKGSRVSPLTRPG